MADISKALENMTAVKLRGGIFGKAVTLLIVLIISVGTVCSFLKIWWVALFLMLPVIGVVLYTLKRCLDFAETNPQAAIMDGAEFLKHETLMFTQKNGKIDPSLQISVIEHEQPKLDTVQTSLPDVSPSFEPSSQSLEDK